VHPSSSSLESVLAGRVNLCRGAAAAAAAAAAWRRVAGNA